MPEERRKQAIQLGELYLSNQKQYGYSTWYEWSINTWGTKWNAYNQKFEEPNILWFDTAWNSVTSLIGKLSEKFPNVEFSYAYADEYLGSNNGKGTAKEHEENIKRLLNFFPVIGEDENGKMVELDPKQVLSIPRRLKSQEVVKRGFMSNFL